MLDAMPPLAASAPEPLLLRGQALIRLRRFSEAIAVLDVDPSTQSSVEDVCRLRLLLAAAYSHSSDNKRASGLLDQVDDALRGHVVPDELAAEIAYHRAHALRREGDVEGAERAAIRAQSLGRAPWSVLAIGTRGYLRIPANAYAEAYRLFCEALAAYETAAMRDDHWQAIIMAHIANMECPLRSAAFPGTYARRSTTPIDFAASAAMRASGSAMYTLDAWSAALDGNRPVALRFGRRATELVRDDPYDYLTGLAHRALLAKRLANPDAAADHAADALELARRIDWGNNMLHSASAVLLAEYFADLDPAISREMLRCYAIALGTIAPTETTINDTHDLAHIAFINGVVHRTEGRVAEAHRAFRDAYTAYTELGIRWRATFCLLELDTVPVPDPEFPFPLDDAARAILADYPHSFLADRLGAWRGVYDDPIASSLSPVRLHVLRRLLDGASAKEIAEMLGLSVGNVRNRIAELQAAFGVASMQELLTAVRARGIGAPSWVPAHRALRNASSAAANASG
ncbi:MAG: LuxR C-terminal-related transcriptional regulator [Vulcanimicrobiaceae bacterium]